MRSPLARSLSAALALLLWPAAACAAPSPQPFGTNDGGGFHDVLPPGTNGLANPPGLAAFLSLGARPAHNDDQRDLYANLVFGVPGLKADDLGKYYKDSTFGVPGDQVERTYSPRDDVTIVRDSAYGVPHIYGDTRAAAMFGIGYATAEDRLFFIDVLRHAGRSQLASFAGGAEGNRQMDRDTWKVAPYTEADLQKQVDDAARFGLLGQIVKEDSDAYLAGINQYIAEAKLDPMKMPAEYAAIGRPQGPDDFKTTDIIATASLVGGIFGKGGGGEIGSALTREAFLARFGAKRGDRVWRDFRSEDDSEAPTTVRGKRFPYLTRPKKPKGVAIPDPGTYKPETEKVESTGGEGRRGAPGIFGGALSGADRAFSHDASNFLVVSARESQSGHPIAVMGPQVSYFAPEILMEQDVHAPAANGRPSIDAAGAAFPGVNLYVELGHGRDYAWSATSAGDDLIDTFALPLCDPAGGAASLKSAGYLFRGRCLKLEVLDRTNSWQPTLADQTPAGSETIRALRTKMGIVAGRATLHGKPVVYVYNRTTYRHEVDNATAGFLAFNTPEMIKGPRDFQQAAYHIGYTFNWVYADSEHIAYFNSGDNPIRDKRIDPRFPVEGKYEWRHFDAERNLPDFMPFSQHPQAIDQDYFTSWNNKQAPGFRANDENYAYGPVDRVQTLSRRVEAGIKGPKKMSLIQLVEAMGDAGTVDLRGQEVLPSVFKIMRGERDAELRKALSLLQAWVATGAHRRDRDKDGKYDDADAVALMDAWWPLLLHAEFEPALGKDTFDALHREQSFHDDPHGHLGSAFDDGWYGFVNKDLRMLLDRKHVKGRWSRTYCGGDQKRSGTKKACAAALAGSLKAALAAAKDRAKQYPANGPCAAGDQVCWDRIEFRAIGGITQPWMNWINRPTFQQANEVQHQVPREAGAPFAYPPRT